MIIRKAEDMKRIINMRCRVFSFASVFICLLCIAQTCYAVEQKTKKVVLENGLTVLVTEKPNSPVVSVYGLVKAGSATEGEFLGSGLSHYLEHMLFKETESRGVGQIAAQIQAVGGTVNAATSMDYTIYTVDVPYDQFDMGLNILADMLMHSTLNAQEMEKERTVIHSEMKLYEDNPDRRLSRMTFENVYLLHPYRHPVIGYKSLFDQVSHDDLMKYYKQFYAPNNIIISVAGNVDGDLTIEKIKNAFAGFERSISITRNLPQEPVQITERHYEEFYSTDATRFAMAFGGVSLLDRDLFALDVLGVILGDGRSSRLYNDVYKNKNLVHSISSWNYTPVDRGFFVINALLELKNTQAAINAVWKNIDKIKNKGVEKSELEKAKRQVLSEHIMDKQKASAIAYSQALDEAFTGDYDFSRKYVDAIRRVTNDDIIRVANQYLQKDNLTVVVLKPKSAQTDPQEPATETMAENDIEKFTLKNGLTVLLRQDKSLALVSIRLSLNGGTRFEAPSLNGISEMTSSLLIKGTKKHSAQEIADISENKGMHLSTLSGRNSIGLSVEALSEDLNTALGLVKEILTEPVFAQNEMDKLKEIIKVSIKERDNEIFDYSEFQLMQRLFKEHYFRLDGIGSVETVEQITRRDIQNFYKQLAVANHMVLAVFGDFEKDELKKTLEKMFGDMPSGELLDSTHSAEPLSATVEENLYMDREQALVLYGFHGTTIDQTDKYGLEVLTSIIGSSFSGRLFNNIREQLGAAYTMGAYSIPGFGSGMTVIYVLTKGEEALKVKDLVRKEIEKIQNSLVDDKELQETKTYLKGTNKARLETNKSLALTVSLDELYGLGYQDYQNYDKYIDALTKEDLQRLAKQYLDLNKAVIIVTRPEKFKAQEGMAHE